MTTFVLVHGAWHGSWCWTRLRPLLEAQGHGVLLADLPGHGNDPTPPGEVSLEGYARAVLDVAAESGGPVVAVGHSMGGMVLSQAAALQSDAFSLLVYVCAFVPADGESLGDLARQDPGTELEPALEFGPSTVTVEPSRAPGVFYGGCSPQDAAWATAELCPQPLRPTAEPFRGSLDPGLPRAYVTCTRDRAVSPRHQQWMRERTRFDRNVEIASDHSPFLSCPDALAAALTDLLSLAKRAQG